MQRFGLLPRPLWCRSSCGPHGVQTSRHKAFLGGPLWLNFYCTEFTLRSDIFSNSRGKLKVREDASSTGIQGRRFVGQASCRLESSARLIWKKPLGSNSERYTNEQRHYTYVNTYDITYIFIYTHTRTCAHADRQTGRQANGVI